MKYPNTLEEFSLLPTVLQDVVLYGIPSIDDVLDLRNKMSELKDLNEDELIKDHFNSEIATCDIVLKVIQQMQDDNLL